MSFRYCLVLFACLPAAASGRAPKMRLPISIHISTATPTMKVGSDLRIELTITNNSNQELDTSANISDVTGIDPNYVWDVRNSADQETPKKVHNNAELATGHAVFGTLNAKETATIEQDISRLFDFSQPGEYFIEASRRVPQDGKAVVVKSNKIKITVTR